MRASFFIVLLLACLSLLISFRSCDFRDTAIIEGLDTSFHYGSNTLGELNLTIVKEWEALGETIHPFKTKDEMVVEIRPNPVDYKQNNDVAVCRSDTYLILFYPSRVMDAGIRKLIRRGHGCKLQKWHLFFYYLLYSYISHNGHWSSLSYSHTPLNS